MQLDLTDDFVESFFRRLQAENERLQSLVSAGPGGAAAEGGGHQDQAHAELEQAKQIMVRLQEELATVRRSSNQLQDSQKRQVQEFAAERAELQRQVAQLRRDLAERSAAEQPRKPCTHCEALRRENDVLRKTADQVEVYRCERNMARDELQTERHKLTELYERYSQLQDAYELKNRG